MPKKGLQPQKPMKQRSDCTLTKGVAAALTKIVRDNGTLFTEAHWKTNQPIYVQVGEEKVPVKPKTYHSWIVRDNIPEGSKRTLRQMMAQAKEERWMKRHQEQLNELVKEARTGLRALQKLPLGTQSRLVRKKYRFTSDGKYQSGEEVEELSVPVDPRIVSVKHKANEFVAKSLDPSFVEKTENKNLNVTVSLSDLRKAKEEEERKQHADYEQ